MKTTSILDQGLHKEWGGYVFHPDDILWTGKPKFEFKISFLEKDYYHDVMSGAVSPVVLYSIVTLAIASVIYNAGYSVWAVLFGFFAAILPFGYEYFRYRNQLKTQYAITKNYVLYKLFNGFTYRVKTIPLNNILDAQLLDIKEDSLRGTVLLVTQNIKGLSQFRKRADFSKYHPALESVQDYERAHRLIHTLIAPLPKTRLTYQAPLASQHVLKPVKVVMTLLLAYMAIYMIDFFVLPTHQVNDHVFASTRVGMHDGDTHSDIDLGGRFVTQSGITFFMDSRYPDVQSEKLEIHLTPVFKIVKKVKTPERDFSDKLESSLHSWISRIGYFLSFIAIFVGLSHLYRRNEIQVELLWKIVIAPLFFLLLYYLAWRLNN